MKRRRTVEQWRRDVFRAPSSVLPAAVKLLLLYMADHMNQTDHKVSVPRETLARDLGVHKARVAERLAKAVAAEYLTRVSAGYPGRTAEYQACWPRCVQQSGIHMGTAPTDPFSSRSAGRIPGAAERGMDTALLDANTEADLSVSPTDRNVGNDEETEDQPARSDLPVCSCHGDPLDDCTTPDHAHDREESA